MMGRARQVFTCDQSPICFTVAHPNMHHCENTTTVLQSEDGNAQKIAHLALNCLLPGGAAGTRIPIPFVVADHSRRTHTCSVYSYTPHIVVEFPRANSAIPGMMLSGGNSVQTLKSYASIDGEHRMTRS